jgi:hypothetical protein
MAGILGVGSFPTYERERLHRVASYRFNQMLKFFNNEFIWHSLLVNFSRVNSRHCTVGNGRTLSFSHNRFANAALCMAAGGHFLRLEGYNPPIRDRRRQHA